ncbi:coiled-coil domain-containing protein [Streptococcus vestibularis]|uniref:coiled-coil domain-containing protein n=1 Tax=Streptococcus vestibularis TaxID=1343 RepID=UPI00232F92C6|nr:hypothetical protein [Streptococcus vestibularis]MDB6217695.1 hypothetical protein [Streptococcus vestibularis]
MLIYPTYDGIPEEFLGKIVLFDMDETKKTRGGIEIKLDDDYQIVGHSENNHAPIFSGIIIAENKNTLRVASTDKKLDSFLRNYISKKDKLIQEITSLESELEQEVDLKEREINTLDIEIDKLKNQLEELQQIYKKRKKLVDTELQKNFFSWINSNWFLRLLYSIYENVS